MRVKDILNQVYKKKKDGEMSYHAIKFAEKNNIDLELEITKESSLDVLILLSKQKQKIALEFIRESFKDDKTTKGGFKLCFLKDLSYRQVAKILHPDSKTGDLEDFQFLQEIKHLFWTSKTKEVEEEIEVDYEKIREYFEIEKIELRNKFPNLTESDIILTAIENIKKRYGIRIN